MVSKNGVNYGSLILAVIGCAYVVFEAYKGSLDPRIAMVIAGVLPIISQLGSNYANQTDEVLVGEEEVE